MPGAPIRTQRNDTTFIGLASGSFIPLFMPPIFIPTCSHCSLHLGVREVHRILGCVRFTAFWGAWGSLHVGCGGRAG